MASRRRTGATHIKVVRRPPEERPWPRSPSHNRAGLRGLGGGRGEPQSTRRPPRPRTVAVGRDVRWAGIVAVAGHPTGHDSGAPPVPGPPRSRPRRCVWTTCGSRRLPVEARLGKSEAAPRWMTAALRGLRQEARGLAYNVTFEATHHGPYLKAPTFYIEQGSTETEWADLAASRAIARVLLALEPVDAPIAIGLGGGHYVPRHTDLALRRRIAFGHLLAAYALEGPSAKAIDQAVERTEGATLAYLHRKSLSKPGVRAFEVHLESLGLRVIREADLPMDPEHETS